jgi:glucose dehydrogenase
MGSENQGMNDRPATLRQNARGNLIPVATALATVLTATLIATPALSDGPAAVTHERMLNADAEPGNWMGHGRTYDEQRFSPLTQINEHNAHELGLAWYHDHETFRGVQARPIVVDGVMYNISAWNITTALNAATGEVLWTYDPEVPAQWARYTCCEPISRGLAVWEGKVIHRDAGRAADRTGCGQRRTDLGDADRRSRLAVHDYRRAARVTTDASSSATAVPISACAVTSVPTTRPPAN